jgi:hypothetical protein
MVSYNHGREYKVGIKSKNEVDYTFFKERFSHKAKALAFISITKFGSRNLPFKMQYTIVRVV